MLFFVEHLHISTELIYAIGLLIAVAAMGIAMNGSQTTMMQEDEYQRHSRQKMGGTSFRDLLWEMQGDLERSQKRMLLRLSASDTTDDERRIYAEELQTITRHQDRIYRMLAMRD